MGENAMILSLAGTAFQHNTNCFASFRIAQLQNLRVGLGLKQQAVTLRVEIGAWPAASPLK